MLGIIFIRKDSINFLWFTLPIWYREEKLSIEIAWSVLFLRLTIALFSLLNRIHVAVTFSQIIHQYTANYMNYMEWNKYLHLFLNLSFLYCTSTFGRIICTIHKSYIRWNKFTNIFFFTFWW